MVFCSSLKMPVGNPYLKILDIAKLFVADAPKKKIEENHPWARRPKLTVLHSSAFCPQCNINFA